MGAKLQSLEQLARHQDLGYKIPKVIDVIDSSYFELLQKQSVVADILSIMSQGRSYVPSDMPSELRNKINSIAKKYLGKPLIARSDSLREGRNFSFSGIYESFAIEETSSESLTSAVMQVFSSFNSSRAKNYRSRNNISDDKMEIIIQQFIEPEYSGTILTSNPSFPDDITIELFTGRRSEKTPIVFDKDKKSGDYIFISENSSMFVLSFKHTQLLEDLGLDLEKKLGPSEIEFVIKDSKIYLLQARPINDLQKPQNIVIPKYPKSKFLGESDISRGIGKITLPVVKIDDWTEFQEKIGALLAIDPEKFKGQKKAYYDRMISADKAFSSGYILLLPHLYASFVGESSVYHPLINQDTTMDTLTPHKKAIITTKTAEISNHVMSVAREQGIGYAGFKNNKSLFERLDTGDIVSIYFMGRTAKIFQEKKQLRSIHELYSEVKYKIEILEDGRLHYETSKDIGPYQPYVDDFQLFLEQNTDHKWRVKDHGSIGGIFINQNRQAIMLSGACVLGQYHAWSVSISYARNFGFKPLPKKEFNALVEKYRLHLMNNNS